MLFHGSASVSPQEGEEHRAAPTAGDAWVHSGGTPKREAYCRDTFSSGIEEIRHNHGVLQGRGGKHGCRLPEDGTRGLQIKPRFSDGSLRGHQ